MHVPSFIKTSGGGLLRSYSQIFFSESLLFGGLLLLASFADPWTGLGGICGVFVAQLMAWVLGYDMRFVRNGAYTFNTLMVGLVVGIYYQFNFSALIILLLGCALTFMVTVWLSGLGARQGFPFLSIPFLIGVWTVLLGARGFESLIIDPRGLYSIQEIWSNSQSGVASFLQQINELHLPGFVSIYFKSLGAILFQYNLLAGIIIAAGLLVWSRIGFSLSVLGYATGFLFYKLFQGNLSQLVYTYIGFNFILTAIALGGFFFVPSWRSYLLVIITVPIIALLISALSGLFTVVGLPIYSLPFNMTIILLLLGFGLRIRQRGLERVQFQQFSPERNLYKTKDRRDRIMASTHIRMALPFMGEWRVSQAHNGELTHKGDWKDALDFDMTDAEGKTWRDPGLIQDDFYCYDLPVLSPAKGEIIQIEDGIPDNPVGEANLEENWGNSIVIKHSEFLFSQLSHLKKDSLQVKVGDHVRKGDVVGRCGSSGRSPEPHLHFQLQTARHIGSKTLDYPLSYYMLHKKDGLEFRSFSNPQKGELISNIIPDPLLKNAFRFTPGMRFKLQRIENGQATGEENWECFTDAWNNAYIFCKTTNSLAWYVNDGSLFYFTDFKGNKNSLLYAFYLAAQKILLGFYPDVVLQDRLPSFGFVFWPIQWAQDFIAPFISFIKINYTVRTSWYNDPKEPGALQLESSIFTGRKGKERTISRAKIYLGDNRLLQFELSKGAENNPIKVEARCVET